MSTVAKRRAISRAIARKKKQSIMAPSRMPYISGRGAYRKNYSRPQRKDILPSNLGATLGAAAGSALAGPFGGVIGSGLGHLAQGLIKHITGFGDYSVAVNSLMGSGLTPPEIVNLSKSAVCLRHREYIGDIVASANYTVASYPINPGLETTFPWLAGVADNFEEYMFTGMIFEFKTLSADYTTASSAALGYVAMATQYNPLLPDFPDKIHLENYEFSNSAKPSESFIHPIECKRFLNPVNQLYIRNGPAQAGSDLRLYDLGNFQIATGGNSGSGVLGELWCTYEVCLYKPKLVEADDELSSAHYQLQSVSSGNPLGGGQGVQVPGSTIDLTVLGNSIIFPASLTSGLFAITYMVWGSAASIVAPVISVGANCIVEQYLKSDTVNNAGSPPNATSSVIFMSFIVLRITGPSAHVIYGNAGTLPASITDGDLWVAQVNDDIQS